MREQYNIYLKLNINTIKSVIFSFVNLGPSTSTGTSTEPRASTSRSPGKTVIVRAVSHSTYLGDFFLQKL